MPNTHAGHVKESHLRLAFTDAVVSVPLADDATLQDVARKFRDLTRRGRGDVVSIVVVLKPQEGSSADAMMA